MKAERHGTRESLLFCLILLTTALTGCLDEEGDTNDPSGERVDWDTGDWWEFKIEGVLPAPWMDQNEGQLQDARDIGHEANWEIDTLATFVATPTPLGNDGPTYEGQPASILSDDPKMEFFAAFGLPFATQWEIGLGTSSGTLIERYNTEDGLIRGTSFFYWPMEDGKHWETNFMETPLQMKVTSNGDLFEVTGMSGEEVLLAYSYDPEVNWFRTFELFDGEGGLVLKADLKAHGNEFEGELYQNSNGSFWARCSGDAGSLPASPGTCQTFSDQTHAGGYSQFIFNIAYTSPGPGTISVIENRPDQPEIMHVDRCPCQEDLYLQKEVTGHGQYSWRVDSLFSGEPRWVYFSAFYGCHSIFEVDGNVLQAVDLCGD